MFSQRPYTVRVFNLVEPVTTFYHDLIPFWESKGWQVEVVISRAEYRAGRERKWISDRTRLRWTPAFGLKARGRLSKSIIMLAYVISGVLVSLFGGRVDLNLFLSQPPMFFCWGGILRRLRRQPYQITLMDLYPDVAVQAGMLPAEGTLTRLADQALTLWFTAVRWDHSDRSLHEESPAESRCSGEKHSRHPKLGRPGQYCTFAACRKPFPPTNGLAR